MKNIKKKVFSYHITLSNGQHAAFYYTMKETADFYSRIDIGVAVANNRRSCNDWFNNKRNRFANSINMQVTGRCGIEAMLFFKRCMIELIKKAETSTFKTVIVVQGADTKRFKAYKYVKRFGFIEGVADEQECYFRAFD